jgi:uncharacterized membrane protein YphA (DoxX/SURF4 family)
LREKVSKIFALYKIFISLRKHISFKKFQAESLWQLHLQIPQILLAAYSNDMRRWLQKTADSLYAIDVRSLILFRICLGIILVFEVITKSSRLTTYYTDMGELPRSAAIAEMGNWEFSFHLMNGTTQFQILLFGIQFALAVMVLLGLRTRVAVVFSWLMLISLHSRNGLILSGADCLLRMLLFWAMFLPLDKSYSEKQSQRTLSMATAGIIIQMLLVYLCTGLLKNDPTWAKDYTAVYYALNLEQFTTSYGNFLLQFPNLLKVLTFTTRWLEVLGPILLSLPYLTRWLRLPLVLAFMSFHFGLILTYEIGLFPYICMLGWILFLPTEFWDFLSQRFSKWGLEIERTAAEIQVPNRWFNHLKNGALLYAIVITVLWNISYLPGVARAVPEPLRTSGLILRLDQKWNMFAPYPMTEDGWYVAPGKLRDGTRVDVITGKAVDWEKPKSIFKYYGDSYQRKYMTNVWRDSSAKDLQAHYAKYICRKWNRLANPTRDRQLMSYNIFFMRKKTPPPGTEGKIEQIQLWEHECFNRKPKLELAKTNL